MQTLGKVDTVTVMLAQSTDLHEEVKSDQNFELHIRFRLYDFLAFCLQPVSLIYDCASHVIGLS
jgi:uncharacterized protein (UPF0147 family)